MSYPMHPDFREGENIPVDHSATVQEALDIAQPGRTIEKINAQAVLQLASMAESSLDSAGIPLGQRDGAFVHAALHPVEFGLTRSRNRFACLLIMLERGASQWEISSLRASYGSSRERTIRIEMTSKQKQTAFKYSMKVININRFEAHHILESMK